MQAQMAAPTLPYLLPVLFTVPKPSPESDAEHVFTGCVQGLELLFQHRDGMEGQSLVPIANLNSSSTGIFTFEYETRPWHGSLP